MALKKPVAHTARVGAVRVRAVRGRASAVAEVCEEITTKHALRARGLRGSVEVKKSQVT